MSCRDDDDCFYDSGGSLHDGVKNVRGNVNDDGFSHSDDENEGSDEEGNNMTVSDDNDGVHSVRICDDSHVCGNQRVNGDDRNDGWIGDDDSLYDPD